uniref:Uncharacterized protein n=1 Tax=Arundo donax TaxID=35708 RepID=A0A0A9CLF0_ARUDO
MSICSTGAVFPFLFIAHAYVPMK